VARRRLAALLDKKGKSSIGSNRKVSRIA